MVCWSREPTLKPVENGSKCCKWGHDQICVLEQSPWLAWRWPCRGRVSRSMAGKGESLDPRGAEQTQRLDLVTGCGE